MSVPSEAEVRAAITEYLAREWRLDLDDLDNVLSMVDPLSAVVDHWHVTDDDYGVWHAAKARALTARRERLETAMRDILVEAETEAALALLDAFPWVPRATREPVPA